MVRRADPPSADSKAKESLRQRILAVIDSLRPFIQADAGDVELVDVDDEGVVTVRLLGACIGCPSSSMTLAMGIERNLRDQVPEVTRVICAS